MNNRITINFAQEAVNKVAAETLIYIYIYILKVNSAFACTFFLLLSIVLFNCNSLRSLVARHKLDNC